MLSFWNPIRSALSTVTSGDRDQFIVSVSKAAFKVLKVSVQTGTKDVISVNTKAWDQNK